MSKKILKIFIIIMSFFLLIACEKEQEIDNVVLSENNLEYSLGEVNLDNIYLKVYNSEEIYTKVTQIYQYINNEELEKLNVVGTHNIKVNYEGFELVLVVSIKDTHKHTESDWIVEKEALCLSPGLKYIECTECKERLKIEDINALGHSYGEWKVVQEAKEEADGLKERECSKCHEKEEMIIPHLNHTHNYEEVITNPTCTEKGYTTYICKCKDTYIDNYVDALGHSYGEWEILIDATETANGLKERKCSECGYREHESIPQLSHIHSYYEQVINPTCTEKGYTYYTCSCGDNYIDNYVDELKHLYNEPEYTWSDDNEIVTAKRVCERDSGHIEEEITLTYFINDPEATCLEDGKRIYISHNFANPDFKVQTKEIVLEKIGHDLYNGIKCSRCDYVDVELIFEYKQENGKNILSISSDKKINLNGLLLDCAINKGEVIELSNINEIVFGENIVSIDYLVSFSSLEKVTFSKDLEEIKDYVFYQSTNIKEFIFEGDAPKISDFSLLINGDVKGKVICEDNAKGYDSFLFGGHIIREKGYQEPEIPNITVDEYTSKAAAEAINLAIRINDLIEEKNHQEFALYPFNNNLSEYKIIKDFTLELVKDCKTEEDKIKKIYSYIVDNIEYRDEAMYYSAYQALIYKKAVCGSYVSLMHDMLSAVDILSFYTRGYTKENVYFENVNALVKANSAFMNTHAILTIEKSDGTVSFYDPTWGVTNKDFYYDMNSNDLASYFIVKSVDFIEAIVEGFSYEHYGEEIIYFLHDDDRLYSTVYGTICNGGADIYNYVLSSNFVIRTPNDGLKTLEGENITPGSAYNCGPILHDNHDQFYSGFALANGKGYELKKMIQFIMIQNKYYNKNIEFNIPNFIIEDGFIYYIYSDTEVSLLYYCDILEDIVIPSEVNGYKVKYISRTAFEFNKTIKNVVVSEGIEEIAPNCFYSCNNLEYLSLPSTLRYFGFNFEENSRIEPVIVECPNLKEIKVADNNIYFETVNGVLYTEDLKCIIKYASSSIDSFTLLDTVTEIYPYAFDSSQINHINFNKNLIKIYEYAFFNSRLKDVVVPSGCEVGYHAFSYCGDLQSVVLEEGVSKVDPYVFWLCESLTDVYIPSTLKEISECMFLECKSLYNIYIPEGVEKIGYMAFASASITSIFLPSTLNEIDVDAFYDNKTLYEIYNLSNIEIIKGDISNGYIGENARYIYNSLDEESKVIKDAGFVYYNDEKIELIRYVGNESLVILKDKYNDKKIDYTNSYIFGGQTLYNGYTIGYFNFNTWSRLLNHSRNNIKTVKIESGIELIGDRAFAGCVNIENIYITKDIKVIADYSFADCISLKNIYFDGTINEWININISPNAFNNSGEFSVICSDGILN